MECGNGTLCCDSQFNFDFTGVSEFEFSAVEDTRIIIVTYVKNGSLYVAISFDCGSTFEDAKKIAAINVESLRNIQILANKDQYVIAVKERLNEQDQKRAFAGKIDSNLKYFDFRECPRPNRPAKGRDLKLGLGFRKNESGTGCESVDYEFWVDGNTVTIVCLGHG
jgi:hypothetical protein